MGSESSAIAEEDYRITGSIALGTQHGLSLSRRGKLWSWGYQANGRLGNGQTSGIAVIDPVRVLAPGGAADFDNAAAVAAGYDHSLVISENGEVFGFGRGVFGQLGHGLTSDASVPAPTVRDGALGPRLSGAISIAAGYNFSLAALESGEVFSWGLGNNGRRGDGLTYGGRSYAMPVLRGNDPSFPPLTDIREVVAGPSFGLAREYHENEIAGGTGGVWVWGLNNYGQLGIGSVTSPARAVPMLAAVSTPLSDVWSMAGGDNHTALVRWKDGDANLQGTVWCAGSGWQGLLGNGVNNIAYRALYPEQVLKGDDTPLAGVVQVAAGASHTIAVDLDGHVWAWGSNAYGQLGNNSQSLATKAVQVVSEELDPITGLPIPLENIVSVAVGGTGGSGSSMALDEDGEVWVWGRNNLGQLGNGEQVVWGPTKLAIKHEENHVDEGEMNVTIDVELVKATENGIAEIVVVPEHSGPSGLANIARVETYLDGRLLSVRASPPWSGFATELGAGAHQVYALAFDFDGVQAMSQGASFTIGLNPEADTDGDGLSNQHEVELNIDPQNPDTDGDEMADGFEVYHGFPADSGSNDNIPLEGTGPADDWDGDGLMNEEEEDLGSIPTSATESPFFDMSEPVSFVWFAKKDIRYNLEWWMWAPPVNELGGFQGEIIEGSQEIIGNNQEVRIPIDEITGGGDFNLAVWLSPGENITEDLDNDGLPDYWEKGFSEMLLGMGISPEEWGAGYSDLIAGNIDPGTDYSNEGVTARKIYEREVLLKSQPDEATLSTESESRNIIMVAWTRMTAGALKVNNGTIYPTVDRWAGYGYSFSDLGLLEPSSLVEEIDASAWHPDEVDVGGSGAWSVFQTRESSFSGKSYSAEIQHSRCRWIRTDVESTGDLAFAKITSRKPAGQLGFERELVEASRVNLEFGVFSTDWLEAVPPVSENWEYFVEYLPIGQAPEVLAVNSDFDEGRIDPATGYAIPDCDDEFIALEAERAHLAGKFAQDERITDDMHPGFFGVNPSLMDDDFWDGAIVTLRKLDIVDPDTGHRESGQIRLYGKWGEGASEYRAIVPYNFETLAATDLVGGGINRAPAESVYGTNSPFPLHASYFIEGVHPGKITLEWRFQKGSIDIAYQQEFEIYTEKNAMQWRFDLDYKIRLETANDPSGEIRTIDYPVFSDGYEANMERAAEFYDFYRECYHEPLRSHPTANPYVMEWAGLARLAGSQVVGGLSDSEWGRRVLSGLEGPGLLPSLSGWGLAEVEQLQTVLFQGGWQIFASVGWQHHAYRSSGYEAIEWVATETADPDAPLLLSAWKDFHQGMLDYDSSLINSAALKIADREQNHIIVPAWTTISGLGLGLVDDMFSILGTNPCTPSGLDFTDIFDVPYLPRSSPPKPFGNLATASDRWTWIEPGTAGGIIDTWKAEPITSKLFLTADSLKNDATRFSFFYKVSPSIPILSWDDLDVR